MRALHKLDAAIHSFLIAHSIQLLRIAVGLVFLLFGLLKFFPDECPAPADREPSRAFSAHDVSFQ